MLWRTHIRICNEVLRLLNVNLSTDTYSKFKAGILAPDQWQDYPHHYGKSDAIQTNLQHARQHVLQNNQQDAFYHLGVALHYIQDAYTSVISYNSPNSHEWHRNYEQSIEDSDFVYNVENIIQYLFYNNTHQLEKYSNITSQLSKNVEGKHETLRVATIVGKTQSQQTGKAKVDLSLALKASLVVMESIISSKNNSKLDLALKQSLLKHENFLGESELSTSEVIINLARQVDSLKRKRVTKPGFVIKLKNGILIFRLKMKELHLNHKYNEYTQKRHLLKVHTKYKDETYGIVKPHIGWYNYSIPELNLNLIKNQLIPIQEASENFGVKEESVTDLVNSGRIRSYKIGNQSVVVRRQLTLFLA